jgi:hypothetical protein
MAEQGYNLVKYPRADIGPLDVVADVGGRFEWLGGIGQIWNSTAAVPAAGQSTAPDFQYDRSDEYRGAFGLQILQGLLSGIGGSARGNISKRTTLTFQYHDPERIAVAPFAVGSYLKGGDLDLDNPFLQAFLKTDDEFDSDFFVITEVLRSRRLTVVATNSNSAELAADVQAMAGMANGNVEASAAGQSEKSIRFKGSEPLTFAFKAFEIGFNDGAWAVLGIASSAVFLSKKGAKKGEPGSVVFTGGSPITIRRSSR